MTITGLWLSVFSAASFTACLTGSCSAPIVGPRRWRCWLIQLCARRSVMGKRVTFTSKDPAIARYYDETFGEEFDKAVAEAEEAASNIPGWGAVHTGTQNYTWREVLTQLFSGKMLAEAERQEHYNYDIVDGE